MSCISITAPGTVAWRMPWAGRSAAAPGRLSLHPGRHGGGGAAAAEHLLRLPLHLAQLTQGLLQVAPLRLQLLDARPRPAQQHPHLRRLGPIRVVEVEEIADLGEREAEP